MARTAKAARASVALALALVASPATAQPVVSTEGKWEGSCKRGSETAGASVLTDQQGARMNGVGVEKLIKGPFSIDFEIPGKFLKQFSGTFSRDTSELTGTLTAGKLVANCSMARKVETPNRVCIRNVDAEVIYWRLEPGSGSTMRLQKGQSDSAAGSRGGKVCWDTGDFNGSACPRSLPQSSYAC